MIIDPLRPDLETVAPAETIAHLAPEQRVQRVRALTAQAHGIVDDALAAHLDGKDLAGVVILWSGGNDSNTLAHLMRARATHAAHANTGIGIEQTREHVRHTCRAWGLPLLEKHAPQGATYRDLVTGRTRTLDGERRPYPGGFPGAGAHGVMFQRLKERGLRQVRAELVTSRRQRVLFLAGRRRDESARRSGTSEHTTPIPLHEREGSIIWASPLAMWTKLDLITYRMIHDDVPRNSVSDLIHMSGECLCGAYAAPGELDAVGEWFPDVRAEIVALEAEVRALRDAGELDIPEHRCKWGWEKNTPGLKRRAPRAGGAVPKLCTSCDARFRQDELDLDGKGAQIA